MSRHRNKNRIETTENQKDSTIAEPETEGTAGKATAGEAADKASSEESSAKAPSGESADKVSSGETAESLLEKEKEKVEEEKKKYVYLMAEFDNYRRRVSQEKLDLIDTASKGVINDLLPVVDNFERALKSLQESEASESAKMGTELIYKQLLDVLKKKGVTEIEAMGTELDTDEHEAVAQIPAPEEKLKGKVVDVIQKGYKLNGKVIRFAKVVIGI
ncbi:MAG: nucleotide exchange factor GrpE [Bacteroidales bacterium]|nr:nucleotide exchange factor GrpE [Bacteroidales bacterium]